MTRGTAPRTEPAAPPSTREALLQELLRAEPGALTIDELAEHLGITRNAVRQQVTALERDGLVMPTGFRPTGRRPSRTYGLTVEGRESFPRRYDLLSVGMLQSVRARLGEEAAEAVLEDLAEELAAKWLPSLTGLPKRARNAAVVDLMNELGYHAHLGADGETIAAINCVYHRVAQETRAVCRFDERLLSLLLGTEVRLSSCMADGAGSCVFTKLRRGPNAGEDPP